MFWNLYTENGKIGKIIDFQMLLQKSITTDLGKSFIYERDKDIINFNN